ncbi:hypothetical protein U1Q18_004222 [Sarracenia purpurea var. burkii]
MPRAECTEEECTKFSVDNQIDSPKSVVGVSYSSEGDLYGALNAADGEELCGFSSEMGMVGKNAANVKFSADFHFFTDLPLIPGVHLDVDDAETETIHSEAMIVANAVADTHDDNNRDNGRSLTTCATKLQDLRQNGLAIYEVCSPENFQESGIEKVDQQIVASSNLDYVTHNKVPCDSKSELLNNVTAASMAALSGNSLHVVESHSDLFSSHQNDQDSKSKSPEQINVIENIDDAAPSPSNHIAEMRAPLEGHADASYTVGRTVQDFLIVVL